MNTRDRAFFTVLGLVGLLSIFMLSFIAHYSYTTNKACVEAGFVNYRSVNGLPGCEDLQGNIHFVKMKGFSNKIVNIDISVGEVQIENTTTR